jgi:hypothetical protein
MTDEEFEQIVRDIAAATADHPEADTISLPPNLANEFERRGFPITGGFSRELLDG